MGACHRGPRVLSAPQRGPCPSALIVCLPFRNRSPRNSTLIVGLAPPGLAAILLPLQAPNSKPSQRAEDENQHLPCGAESRILPFGLNPACAALPQVPLTSQRTEHAQEVTGSVQAEPGERKRLRQHLAQNCSSWRGTMLTTWDFGWTGY